MRLRKLILISAQPYMYLLLYNRFILPSMCCYWAHGIQPHPAYSTLQQSCS